MKSREVFFLEKNFKRFYLAAARQILFGCRQADFIHPEGRDGGSVSTSIPPPISGEKVLQERSVLASLPIDPLYTRH